MINVPDQRISDRWVWLDVDPNACGAKPEIEVGRLARCEGGIKIIAEADVGHWTTAAPMGEGASGVCA